GFDDLLGRLDAGFLRVGELGPSVLGLGLFDGVDRLFLALLGGLGDLLALGGHFVGLGLGGLGALLACLFGGLLALQRRRPGFLDVLLAVGASVLQVLGRLRLGLPEFRVGLT